MGGSPAFTFDKVGNIVTITGNLVLGNLSVTGITASTLDVAGGGLNAVSIGQTTPAAGSFTSLTATGKIWANSSVSSTSTSTGALVVAGGIGVGGSVYAPTFYGNLGGGSVLSNIYVTGSILPTTNVAYDLGSPTQKFRSAYFSGNTVYIGGESMSVAPDGTWSFTSDGAEVSLGASAVFNPPAASIGELTTNAASVTGNVSVTGNISAASLNISGNILAGNVTFNAITASTLNVAGGGLNAVAIGQSSPAAGDFTRLAATGTVYANATAAAISTTSGALRVAGGAGVAGNTVISGILTAGTTSGINIAAFTNTIGWFTGSANSWTQFGLQNTNTGQGASTDFIAYADNGNNDSGWIDMGITGQNYVNQDGAYGITGPNDGYIFMSGVDGAGTGGNLVIATGNTGVYNDIVIATGGFDTIHEEARFIAHTGLRLIQGTSSINPTTGALQVVGGVGIGGNLNVAGDISLAGNIYLTGNAIQFNTNNLTLTDSLIYLAEDNGADVIDIGIVGSYTSGLGYQHTGVVRDASDGVWKIFSNVASEPTTTVDFTNATYSNIKVGNISAVSAGFDSNVTASYFIGTLGTAAQPAITSVGTLTGLTSSGLINTSGNVLASSATLSALTVNGFINTTANLSASRVNSDTTVVSGASYIGEVFVTSRSGDEGGQINLAPAVTNNALVGNITVDIFQNKLRIFESGGTNRGGYFDLSGLATGVGTNLAGGGGGVPGGGPNQIQFNQAASFAGAASLYYYGANGAVVSNAGIASTSTTTGSFQIGGGIGVTGAVVAGQLNSAGNLLAQAGVFNGLTVNGNIGAGGSSRKQLTVGAYLDIYSGAVDSPTVQSIRASSAGNMVINPYGAGATYLSYDAGTGGVNFGSGSATIVANVTATGVGTFAGLNVSAAINPNADNTINIGSSGTRFATVYGVTFAGVSTTAKYADLAEIYASDKNYVPGTVVVFGGDKEVTISTASHDPSIAGVVSTNPAYLMNDSADGLAIALQGRVPCRVKGPIKKGDRVVASNLSGIAQCLNMTQYQPGCIIGKALESIDNDSVQTIEVVVGRV